MDADPIRLRLKAFRDGGFTSDTSEGWLGFVPVARDFFQHAEADIDRLLAVEASARELAGVVRDTLRHAGAICIDATIVGQLCHGGMKAALAAAEKAGL